MISQFLRVRILGVAWLGLLAHGLPQDVISVSTELCSYTKVQLGKDPPPSSFRWQDSFSSLIPVGLRVFVLYELLARDLLGSLSPEPLHRAA